MNTRFAIAAALIAVSLACHADDSSADVGPGPSSATEGAMEPVTSFGANPGALKMYKFIPEGLPSGAPLVVVLHGCTQSASSMVAAGWNALASNYKFAVVYAEQVSGNNPVTCFNWAGEYGDPANLVRGQGENQSIASMVEKMIGDHASDSDRVYISGFSAGGAFAAVMLATWPDMFAAGAIQSGVPYRCATTVNGASQCQGMGNNPGVKKSAQEWGDLVRAANPGYGGRRPRVAIWHGANDTFIVHHDNLIELTEQWTNVLGLGAATVTDTVAGAEHTAYVEGGRTMVETFRVPALGHAIAMGADDPDLPCALSGFAQYFEDRGICSTARIATFFGLTGAANPDPGCESDCEPTIDDDTAPAVNILDPGPGALVAGTVLISAEASDDVEVDRVEFFVDGQLQETARSAPYQFSWPTVAFSEGQHSLMAIAYDSAGNIGVDDDTGVEVDNDGNGAERGFSGCASGSGSASIGFALFLLGVFFRRYRRPRRSRRH